MSISDHYRALDEAPEQSAIDAAASAWLVRLNEGPRSPAVQAEFEAWLAVDPRHGDTYDALWQTWEDAGELKHLRWLADPEPVPPLWRRWISGISRTGLAGAVATASVCAIAILIGSQALKRPDAQYDTAIAELRPVTLADGSVVTLGADSEIEVRFTPTERHVALKSGEAFFEVTHDAARPFFVDAGMTTVRVVGTKFELSLSPDQVDVSVLEGRVEVNDRDRAREDGAVLSAGEKIAVVRRLSAFAAPVPMEKPKAAPAASVAAWRGGRLSYDDATLADLVDDVNRYYAPGVELSSSDVGRLRITASFRTNEIPAFLDGLSSVLPVQVAHGEDQSFTVSARASGR